MGVIGKAVGVKWETLGVDRETVGQTVLVMGRLKQCLKINPNRQRGFGVTEAPKRMETPSLSEMRAKQWAIVA